MNESMGRWIIGFFKIRISYIILHTFTSDLNLPQATYSMDMLHYNKKINNVSCQNLIGLNNID